MDLKSFLNSIDKDLLVGLSIPLCVAEEDSVFIGYYNPATGPGHIVLTRNKLKSASEVLYTGKYFPIAVHGLKRIREAYELPDLELEHEKIWDTRLMGHLLDPGRDDDHGYQLSALVREYLKQDYPYIGEDLFAQDYPEFLFRGLEKDAELIFHVAEVLKGTMDTDLLRLYHEVELPVSSVLVNMHLDGIAVDQVACTKYLEAAVRELQDLESGFNFRSRNLFSGKDTYWFLHNRGIEFPEDMGGGFRIDDEDLKELAGQHDVALAAQILQWRKLKRDVRFLEMGAGSERVHPVWRMTRTSTGRIVASDPPIQNIDKKKYRPLLIASPGHILVKADWKTCQARILAHLSQDPELIRLFTDGEDIHTRTARMLGLGSRDEAKPINFGIIFGQGSRALAREISSSWNDQGKPGRVDEGQAQTYIDTFFATYKRVLPYFDEEYRRLTGTKVPERVLTNPLTGRIRRFPGKKSRKLMREMKATLLQQVESHLLKISLIRLSNQFQQRGLDAEIVACIHDSIWVDSPANKQGQVREIMESIMTTVVNLSEPPQVDFE